MKIIWKLCENALKFVWKLYENTLILKESAVLVLIILNHKLSLLSTLNSKTHYVRASTLLRCILVWFWCDFGVKSWHNAWNFVILIKKRLKFWHSYRKRGQRSPVGDFRVKRSYVEITRSCFCHSARMIYENFWGGRRWWDSTSATSFPSFLKKRSYCPSFRSRCFYVHILFEIYIEGEKGEF